MENKSSEIDSQFARLPTKKTRFNDTRKYRPSSGRQYNDQNRRYDNWQNCSQNRKPYVHVKKCEACKMVGEPFIGHELRNCPNVRQSDRANVIKCFQLEVKLDELPGDNFRDAH